ncbi:MAG TPA: nucleoside phosphorylase [Flavobacteriales bacterium]
MKAQLRESHTAIPSSELVLRSDGSLYHIGVRPEHVAPKVIIVGDPERVPMISAMFNKVDFKVQGREFVVHTGEVNGKRITVISSGIGVDNIDIIINELDAAVNIDLETRKVKEQLTSLEIVRIGTCGSMHADIPVGSIVSSAYAFAVDGVPHTYGCTFSDDEQGLLNGLRKDFTWLATNPNLYAVKANEELLQRIAQDTVQGITATANGFYGPQGRTLRLQSNMEKNIDAYASFNYKGLSIINFEMECAGIYALASMLGHKPLTLCVILANRVTKEFHNNPSASVESLIRLVLERF